MTGLGKASITAVRTRSFALLMLAVFGGNAGAQPAQDGPAPAQTSLKLTSVIFGMPTGAPYLKVTQGVFCVTPAFSQVAPGGKLQAALSPYVAAFKPEIEGAGYHVVSAEDNLFGQEDSSAADYQVAAVITDLRINICSPDGGRSLVPNQGRSSVFQALGLSGGGTLLMATPAWRSTGKSIPL
jgi:hypothetical protein